MNVLILIGLAAILSMFFVAIPKIDAQVPEHCGYSEDNRCAVPSEEDAQKILEVFPDAIVVVDEELYESIPEDDRKDADEIIEAGARESDDDEDSEDSGESGSSSAEVPQQNNFQPIPPGQQNLPPAQQPGSNTALPELMDECLAAGNSRATCEAALISPDFGICKGLGFANVPCPVQ